MAEKLKELSSQERKDRIKLSILSEKIAFLNTPAGLDWFLKNQDYTEDEKEYVLFNINDLDIISRLPLCEFRARVKNFKEGKEDSDVQENESIWSPARKLRKQKRQIVENYS